MAVVVGRMLAVLEAQTSQFEARMGAASQQIQRWNSTTVTARRGTQLLKAGFQQLAFEGLGMMPPQLARVSAGLLTLAGPGGLLLGAVAVLGVLSMAFEHAGKKAEEFVAEANKVREFQLQHLQMLGGIGGERKLTPAEQLATLRSQRAGILAQIEARKPLLDQSVLSIFGKDPVAQRAKDEIDALTESLKNLDRAILDLRRDQAGEGPFFLLQRRGATFAPGAFGPDAIRTSALASPHFMRDPFANVSTTFGHGSAAPVQSAGFRLTPELAVMMAMAGLQGVSSGSVGGFLGAAAGPIAMVNPLAGAITSLFGGFASLFERQHSERERNEERRKNEIIGAIHEGPVRVSETFVGDASMGRYAMARDERLGGEPRLGGL